jgi:uncharacterized protein
MMKNRLLASGLATLLALTACGRAESAPKSADPAMWVVKDHDTTIYLFGTIHIMKPGIRWFDDEVKTAFDSANELVTEFYEPDTAKMYQAMSKMALNTDAPPTTQLLKGADLERYSAAVKSIGSTPQEMDMYDPWMAAITLSIAPLKKLGYEESAGTENVLEEAAKLAGKKRAGFETVDQQLGYFEAMPHTLQIAFLNDTVSEMAGAEKQFDSLIKDWSRGNVSALGKEMNSSLEKTPELERILLFERNARWAQWIKARMDQPGIVFVAVGSGHLAGKESLLDKLQTLGLKARRVKKQDFAAKSGLR